MSVEPTCRYCNKSTKFCCRNEEEALVCTERKPTGYAPPPSSPPSSILMTITDTSMEIPVTVESPYGDAGTILIRQERFPNDCPDEDRIVIPRDKIENLINNLRLILAHTN